MTKIRRFFAMLFVVLALSFSFQAKPAQATCCPCTDCFTVLGLHMATQVALILSAQTQIINEFFMNEVMGPFTQGYIQGALMSMTMEMSAATQMIGAAIGPMIDASVMNDHILELQTAQAKTARDHIPAVSMCEFATLSGAVASAQSRSELTREVLSKRAINRHLGVRGLLGAEGLNSIERDLDSRFNQYLARYCDPWDQNTKLGQVYGGNCNAIDERINRDIDFGGLLYQQGTLNLDFSNGASNDDELDVINLHQNLFPALTMLRAQDGVIRNEKNHDEYLAVRSLIAKRSVAENSLHALIGLRTFNPDRQDPTVGISYWEDMERLTKGHYQDPSFFANLYDNPANVKRQKAAMQGIGLMQHRDLFETQIRSEMLFSIMLETQLEDEAKRRMGGL